MIMSIIMITILIHDDYDSHQALRGTTGVMSMTKILADAVSLGVDLDELSQVSDATCHSLRCHVSQSVHVSQLKEQLKEQRWVEAAELSLSSTVSLEVKLES